MARLIYTVLFYILLPLICLRLWIRGKKAPAYRERWAERFGFGAPQLPESIWVHAVSVGETLAAQPLVNALLVEYPNTPIVVTTMTPTGSDRVKAIWGDRVHHVYAPYDTPDAITRFLSAVKPRVLVIMETELWPNTLQVTRNAGVPVMLANARLSERSALGYGKVAFLTDGILESLSLIAAQDQATAERFIALGMPASKVQVTGSIKFDFAAPEHMLREAAELRESWQLSARPVMVAASTHAGEDESVLAAFRQVREVFSNAFLILVPRHPERFDEVAQLLELQSWSYVRRSYGVDVAEAHDVLLGDSMGELPRWLAMGDICFMGGSFVPVGGHNMLEPIALGLPCLSGPHVFNFQAIADELVAADALAIVNDADELAQRIITLWQEPALWGTQREAGLAVIARNKGSLPRQLGMISQLLGDA